MTIWEERESRLPVGSSAKIISGLETSERAMATRCFWPPESWWGKKYSRSFKWKRERVSEA